MDHTDDDPLANVDTRQLDEWMRRQLAGAPPLTREQREAIAALIAHDTRTKRHGAA